MCGRKFYLPVLDPVQFIRTNGDGLCSAHSVFGVLRNTGRRSQTELYYNDAKTFIRQSFGVDYIAFSRTLDNPNLLAEVGEYDLVRSDLACLLGLL